MSNFLVIVKPMSLEIHLVESVSSFDWQCEIGDERVSYQIKIDRNVEKKKLAKERANVAIVNHALDFADGQVVRWKTRGNVAARFDKKKSEIESKMRKLL